jgi:hypothetical protein
MRNKSEQIKSVELLIEGAESIFDIYGEFYFNSHRNYSASQSAKVVWENVGSYFGNALEKFEFSNYLSAKFEANKKFDPSKELVPNG